MKGDRQRGKQPDEPIGLVAFLGNPGRQYARSRHNVAWMVADRYSRSDPAGWKEKFHGRFERQGETVLLEPDTFMNHSGRSVQAACSFFQIPPARLLLVHDDLETAFGRVELAWAGGHRGQNGVRSTVQALGSGEFWRLRVGIGRPPGGRSVGDWVLERFSSDEEARLDEVLGLAASLLRDRLASPREERRSLGA